MEDLVGSRIRMLRRQKGWTLEALSARSGLSVGFLSQVERGLSSLSISSLQAICASLGVPLTHFFALPQGNSQVLRAGEPRTRVRIEDSDVNYSLLSGAMPDRVLEALIAEFPPQFQPPMITHGGEEFGYVLAGKIILTCGDQEWELGVGDSFHFYSTQQHTIRNPGDVPAKVLWVLTQKLLEGGISTDGEASGDRHRRDLH